MCGYDCLFESGIVVDLLVQVLVVVGLASASLGRLHLELSICLRLLARVEDRVDHEPLGESAGECTDVAVVYVHGLPVPIKRPVRHD